MDENLRVALIQFLNHKGEAPDPAGGLEVHPGVARYEVPCLEVWYHDARGQYRNLDLTSVGDLLQFLLEYQVT